MSAADRREELEAAIHRQLTRAWKYGLDLHPPRPCPADLILAAADAYAQACADDAWAAAEGQARLAGQVTP